MKTLDEIREIHRGNARYVRSLSRMYTKAQVGKETKLLRSVEVAVTRLSHIFHLVAHSYNKIAGKSNRHMYLQDIKGGYRDVLNHKYLGVTLSIMQLLSEEQIELDRWMLAQSETLTIPVFTLYQCYGYNALSRYSRWESKQQTKFQNEEDRSAQTYSKERAIHRSIAESHQTALKWTETLKQIEPPSEGAALWYLWPSVSVWYLLAHKAFTDEVMMSGFVANASLYKKWKLYLRSPHIQEVCKQALQDAEAAYGRWVWKA
jgi:hypothetical protein